MTGQHLVFCRVNLVLQKTTKNTYEVKLVELHSSELNRNVIFIGPRVVEDKQIL